MISDVRIYTDGSCHAELLIGAWAAIIFLENEKFVLSGILFETTHQRMELTAAIKALEYVRTRFKDVTNIDFQTDSQYVAGLLSRSDKLISHNFLTKNGKKLRNQDLVISWIELNKYMSITTDKIKSHQKISEFTKYNIEVDKLSRKLVRDAVNKMIKSQVI